jgi:hypothetical protein
MLLDNDQYAIRLVIESECEACGSDALLEIHTRSESVGLATLCEDCFAGWLRGTLRGVMARVRERRKAKEEQEQAEVTEE